MTTPEGSSKAAEERVRRPRPQREGPKRAATGALPREAEASINESVAHAVRTGYDVIAENIRQGREAAAKFRQGEYNIRDVPGDLETVLLRLIHLAREVSTTTFDVCERLLKEVGGDKPPPPSTAGVPPFPSPSAKPAAPRPEVAPGRMKLTARFVGTAKAVAITEALDRPRRPTTPKDLAATPLTSRQGATIPGVTFETDMSVEGLIAVITIPKDQAVGVYSGLVHAANDEVPLGVLTVEILI